MYSTDRHHQSHGGVIALNLAGPCRLISYISLEGWGEVEGVLCVMRVALKTLQRLKQEWQKSPVLQPGKQTTKTWFV
jgi:hypothetical protein